MFRHAYAIAREFTLPVILSRCDFAGKCSASIGAFVVVNNDGWIVTAGHMLQQIQEVLEGAEKANVREASRKAIEADTALDAKERRNRLIALGKPNKTETQFGSALWGALPGNPQLLNATVIPFADVGVGKLEPFDPAWITKYPVFKDPSKNFEPGVSLCKLGFPFHGFEPTFDAAANSFILPPGALPAPLFPIDGLFTRSAELAPPPNQAAPPFPMLWVETSSPGLRGQSGGPTLDEKGTVWAIQCQTSHLSLGFSNKIPEQYLHVGLGVHPTTLFKLFDQVGMKYQVSNY